MVALNSILKEIAHLKFVGDSTAVISIPSPLNVANQDSTLLMWVNEANIDLLDQLLHGTVICSTSFSNYKPTCNYIIVERPRLAFKEITTKFFSRQIQLVIHATAQIHPSAIIGTNVYVGHHVVIEENCVVGNDCFIGHNTVLHYDTLVGTGVKIGANNTIGGVGFGYEKDIDGEYSLIPHLGNVVLKDNVEIGNNTCIDRAVLGSTVLHENVKVDNLVHIAHGVVVGKNSLIIANAMVAGSTIIGENVWFAPSASVLNKRTIANNAIIGMGAVVVKNVNEAETIVGNPGKVLNK